MKTLILTFAIFTLSFNAQAQENVTTPEVKIEATVSTGSNVEIKQLNEVKTSNEIARVHKNRNYKIIKELKFRVSNKSKMA